MTTVKVPRLLLGQIQEHETLAVEDEGVVVAYLFSAKRILELQRELQEINPALSFNVGIK